MCPSATADFRTFQRIVSSKHTKERLQDANCEALFPMPVAGGAFCAQALFHSGSCSHFSAIDQLRQKAAVSTTKASGWGIAFHSDLWAPGIRDWGPNTLLWEDPQTWEIPSVSSALGDASLIRGGCILCAKNGSKKWHSLPPTAEAGSPWLGSGPYEGLWLHDPSPSPSSQLLATCAQVCRHRNWGRGRQGRR